MRSTRDRAQRFWEKVDVRGPDDCWPWRSWCFHTGYGGFRLSAAEGNAFAHRISWELTNGPIPKGIFICHSCDNRPCVNPGHLFLGTQKDNMTDALQKGRMVAGPGNPSWKGETHPLAKLTKSSVRVIRERYAAGDISQKKLATEFGVTQSTIGRAIRHELWA